VQYADSDVFQSSDVSASLAELVAEACTTPLAIVIMTTGGELRVACTFGALDVRPDEALAFAEQMLHRKEPLVVDNVDASTASATTLFARSIGARALASTAVRAANGCAVVAVALDVSPRSFGVRECRLLNALAEQGCARLDAETALLASTAALDGLFGLSNILLCVFGFDGTFVHFNGAAWRAALGYSEAEFSSKTFWAFVHPDDVERTQAEMAGLLEGKTTSAFENRYRASDGSYRWIAWNARGALESKLIFAAATDVTASKTSGDVRRAHMVQLQRSNADLQEFARVASHDLQEPLRKIISFGDRLATIGRDVLGAEGLDYLRRMRASSERMSQLIESLLELSRVASAAPKFADVDLDAVIAGILPDLEERIASSRGSVIVGRLPVVYGDRAQLQRLFQNLIANALKFHAPGVSPVVRIDGEVLADGRAKVEVSDEGVGFDEKYQARLFKPFQRLHTTREFTGTGMGLAICAKIAERHGGEISARSVLGRGSVFVVNLPAAPRKNGDAT
jgi:PAS domain S-box-containing protein